MVGKGHTRQPIQAGGEAVGPTPSPLPFLQYSTAGAGFKPTSTIPGKIAVGPPVRHDHLSVARSKEMPEEPPPGLEGTSSGLLKPRRGKVRKNDKTSRQATGLRSAMSPSKTMRPVTGKSAKKLTWSLDDGGGGTGIPIAPAQIYDTGPAEDETPHTTPSISRAQSEVSFDLADRGPGTAGSSRKSTAGSSGRRTSTRGSKRTSSSRRRGSDLLPDDRPGSRDNSRGRRRSRSRSREMGGSRGGSGGSSSRGRSGSRSSAAISGSRGGARSLTPTALMGQGRSQQESRVVDSQVVWEELALHISPAQGSHKGTEPGRESASFLELEREWGLSVGDYDAYAALRNKADTPNTIRVRQAIRKRQVIQERHAARPPKASPESFVASMSIQEAAQLSHKTLVNMMAHSSSPPRMHGALAKTHGASPSRAGGPQQGSSGRTAMMMRGGPRGEEGEEGEDGEEREEWESGLTLPAVTAASPSRANGGIWGGGVQAVKEGQAHGSERVAKRTRGRAIEVLEKDAASSGPPIVLKTASRRDEQTHAAKASVSNTYLSDSGGSMWEMPGVPTPAVNASDFDMSAMKPYPVFESKIGTVPSHEKSPLAGAKAKQPPPSGAGLDAISAEAESEMRDMSQGEIRALMETYFPSLEERLRRGRPDAQPTQAEDENSAPHPIVGVPGSKQIRWGPNSMALRRLVEARENPDVQDRLHNLVYKVMPDLRKASRRNASVDHIERNRGQAVVVHRKEARKGPEVLNEAEERVGRVKKFKEERDREMENRWLQKQEQRAERLRYHTMQQIWAEERMHLQRVWLGGLMCATVMLQFLEPLRLRRQSTKIARNFMVSTMLIQRWIRKILVDKRRAVMEKIKRVCWRRLLVIRIKKKRWCCGIIAQFCRDYKKRSRAIAAMESFRAKVLMIQRAIRRFLNYRRFRWLILDLQWNKFEKRRNKNLRREWRKAWGGMMTEISKVFKMPPARLKRDLNSRSIRWVTEMMDEMIAKLPYEIKNIVVVRLDTKERVLKEEKRKIVRDHKAALIRYYQRIEQVKENKAIKDMVTETFPALQEMSAVNAPELQFLMDSDKPPEMPELTPLLPEARLEELVLLAQRIEKEEEQKLTSMSEESSREATPYQKLSRMGSTVSRRGSFHEHAINQLGKFDRAEEAGLAKYESGEDSLDDEKEEGGKVPAKGKIGKDRVGRTGKGKTDARQASKGKR